VTLQPSHLVWFCFAAVFVVFADVLWRFIGFVAYWKVTLDNVKYQLNYIQVSFLIFYQIASFYVEKGFTDSWMRIVDILYPLIPNHQIFLP